MSIYNFPSQRIPENKKDKEWHISHIRNYISYSGTQDYANKRKEIADLYYAYSAVLTGEEKKKVTALITERCGQNFGPEYSVYPLIENKIEELVGKYRKRPIKRKCMVNNPEAVSRKLDAKVDMLTEQVLREANKEMADFVGFEPETENPDMEIPKDIEEFFSKEYRTISEETAEDILYQILIVRKEKERIYEGLKHFLISDRAWAMINEKDGHPTIHIAHPLDCFYDFDPNSQIQDDIDYFCYDKYMSVNEIYNTFDISEKDKKTIEAYAGYTSASNYIEGNKGWFNYENKSVRPRVVSMIWKSRKKVRFKSFENKNGNEEYKILPEDYKERNRDNLKSVEVEDIRHITMIGPDIVLSYGSLEDQMKTEASPNKRFIPVVGLINENFLGTGEIRSVAKKLKYLQDFASEVLYEIRLAMRQTEGGVMVYDLANIPKEFMALSGGNPGKALEKVNFHLKRDRMMIINSRDKKSNAYASSVNISQKGRITDLINLLELIEQLADRISGVKSSQNPYQKATVAEINYESDSDRIEEYFGIFDTYIEKLLERLVLKAKFTYEENDVYSYFLGDNQLKFLSIFPDFFIDDIGIHIGDNRREYEKKQAIDQMAQQLFMNAQSPQLMLDLIKIFNAESASESEFIFKRGVDALEQLREENNKMAQEQQQAQLQAEAQAKEEDRQLTREGHQKDITVAQIYANNKTDSQREKDHNQNLREMAKIEKDIAMLDKKIEAETNKNSEKQNNK